MLKIELKFHPGDHVFYWTWPGQHMLFEDEPRIIEATVAEVHVYEKGTETYDLFDAEQAYVVASAVLPTQLHATREEAEQLAESIKRTWTTKQQEKALRDLLYAVACLEDSTNKLREMFPELYRKELSNPAYELLERLAEERRKFCAE